MSDSFFDELNNASVNTDDVEKKDADLGELVAQDGEGEEKGEGEDKDEEEKTESEKHDAEVEAIPTLSPKGATDVMAPNVTATGDKETLSSATEGVSVDEAKGVTAPEAAVEAAKPDAAPEAIADAPKAEGEDEGKQPELSEAHDEAKPVVDAAPDVMHTFKEAANLLSPALKKLGDYKEALEKLEDEAKARFDHVRQKCTEAVAALEAIFKRG